MDLLKERVLLEGKIVDGDVLQVSSFLNHMIDTRLVHEIGKEFANIFSACHPSKIVTIEASGISIAAYCALELQIPFIIAKKRSATNLTGDVYSTEVFSFTKRTTSNIRISKEFLTKNDKVLIIDDFLAAGGAVEGLMRIINEAKAVLVGVGICIEKSFLRGASNLLSQGVNLHSLVRIESMENGVIKLLP